MRKDGAEFLDGEVELRKRHIGELIKDARRRAGLTQRQVSDRLGYKTSQFVSNWERGLSMPPLETLPKVVEMLKIEPSVLIAAIEAYRQKVFALQSQKLNQLFRGLAQR